VCLSVGNAAAPAIEITVPVLAREIPRLMVRGFAGWGQTERQGRRDYGTEGRRDYGTEGLRDYGTEGLRDYGTKGLRDCGTKGLRDCGARAEREQGSGGTIDRGGKGARRSIVSDQWSVISGQ
jgi:hypothetical protein